MKILFAPFAARTPSLNGKHSPKDYPRARELAKALQDAGHEVIQVGCTGEEQLVPNFRRDLKHSEVCDLIKESDTFIAVDSYLQHAAWSVDKPGIVLWGISDPLIFGHTLHTNLLQDRKYLRGSPFDLYYTNQYCPDAFVSPETVAATIFK